MTSPEEIIQIANTRLEEAKLLLEKDYYSGAFYLSGYSVELALKAKICRVFDMPKLFVETNSDKDINEIRKSVTTHNLYVLLTFSGLKPKYEALQETNPEMFVNIAFVVRNWNEAERYKIDLPVRHTLIKDMLNNLEEFLEWIQMN
jgi:HEPN domain-containing protein